MLQVESLNEHSAKVQIWLEVGEVCLSVAQVGENSLLLADSTGPACDMSLLAHLVTIIDGSRTEYLIAIKGRRGKKIDFEHCIDNERHVQEFDDVPF